MTVRDMQEALEGKPDDMPIVTHDGYTYTEHGCDWRVARLCHNDERGELTDEISRNTGEVIECLIIDIS